MESSLYLTDRKDKFLRESKSKNGIRISLDELDGLCDHHVIHSWSSHEMRPIFPELAQDTCDSLHTTSNSAWLCIYQYHAHAPHAAINRPGVGPSAFFRRSLADLGMIELCRARYYNGGPNHLIDYPADVLVLAQVSLALAEEARLFERTSRMRALQIDAHDKSTYERGLMDWRAQMGLNTSVPRERLREFFRPLLEHAIVRLVGRKFRAVVNISGVLNMSMPTMIHGVFQLACVIRDYEAKTGDRVSVDWHASPSTESQLRLIRQVRDGRDFLSYFEPLEDLLSVHRPEDDDLFREEESDCDDQEVPIREDDDTPWDRLKRQRPESLGERFNVRVLAFVLKETVPVPF